jgi:asparagine synthase (glutamine-hydrolysing)
MTRRHVTVALNGDGGDESFAGYDRYWGARLADRVGRLPGLGSSGALLDRFAPVDPKNALRRASRFLQVARDEPARRYARWMSHFTQTDKTRVCTPDFVAAATSISSHEWFRQMFAEVQTSDAAEAAMAADVRSYLPYDLLVKVDIASMANSLEARSPFLDHEVMEAAARLPTSMKVRGRTGKTLLRKAFRDMLPPENVQRPKMGFGVPVGAWFRGPLRDFLREALLSQDAKDRGYFQVAEVERLIDEHQSGSRDHAPKLWSLLTLELWHRELVDTRAPAVK